MEPTTSSLGIEQLLAHEGFLRRVVVELVDEHQVDDILQETWVAALRAGPGRLGYPRAFLKRVARNLALGRARTEVRRRRRERTAARDEALPSTAAMVERLHAHQKVARAVAALAEPYRTAVLLRYFEDLSPREIARRLDVPASTVRTRLERGLQRVRGRLESEGGDVRALAAVILAPRAGEPVAPVTLTQRAVELVLGVATMTSRHKILSLAVLLFAAASLGLWIGADRADPVDATSAGAQRTALSDSSRDAPGTKQEEPEPPPRTALQTPPPTEPAAPPPLSGRVLDARGDPVAGVPLAFHATSSPTVTHGLTGVKRATETDHTPIDLGTSDHEGRFSAPCAERFGQIAVGNEPRDASHMAVRFYVPPIDQRATAEALLVVARQTAVAGRVVDADGRALGGALVTARLDGLLEFTEPLDHTAILELPQTWTADDGTFSLAPVPDLEELSLTFAKNGHDPVSLRDVAGRRDLVVTLQPEADDSDSDSDEYRVTGTVVADDGRLVAGATVLLHQSRATTGRFGEFEIRTEYLTEESLFGAARPGFQPAARPDVVTGLLAGEPAADVVLRLGPEALSIEGRVLDPRDEPLEGAVITLFSGTQIQAWHTVEDFVAGREAELEFAGGKNFKADARSGPDGAFELVGLSARDYRIRVFDPKTLAATTLDVPAGTRDLIVRVDPSSRRRVRGTVTTRSGTPLEGITVWWGLKTLECGSMTVFAPGAKAETDAAGRFALNDIPTGDAELSISGAAILDHTEPLTGVPDGAELTIRPFARCRVRVEIDDPTATRIRFLDEIGATLEVKRTMGQVSISGDGWNLTSGRTPVLEVSEAARVLVVLRDGEEIARHAVAPTRDPDRVEVLRY